METYDVNIDALMATNVGIAIKDIRTSLLPFLRRREEESRRTFEYLQGVKKELEETQARLQTVRTELDALAGIIEGEVGGRGFRETIAATAGPIRQIVDVDSACASFADWVAGCGRATEGLRSAIGVSLADKAEGVACMTEFLGVFRGAIKFWESALDVYVCDYVFEHSQMKFKTKVCRDIVKMLPPVIQAGNLFLSQFDAGKFDFGKHNEYFRERAVEVVEAAENRLGFYRKIKALIGSRGIAAAFDEWKSANEYSRSLVESNSSSR